MSLRPRLVGGGNLLGIATSLTLLAMTLEKALSLGKRLFVQLIIKPVVHL